MALLIEYVNPFNGQRLTDCYVNWGGLHIVPANKTILVVFRIYENKKARDEGHQPFPEEIPFEIGPRPQPPIYGAVPLLKPESYTPPVYGERPLLTPETVDEVTGEVIPAVYGDPPILEPEQYSPAEYGEAPLLWPGLPSYDQFSRAMDQVIDGQPGATSVIGALVYGFAKSRPEFAGARDQL